MLCSQTKTELETGRLRFVYVDYIFQSSNDQDFQRTVGHDQLERCAWHGHVRWSSWKYYAYLKVEIENDGKDCSLY